MFGHFLTAFWLPFKKSFYYLRKKNHASGVLKLVRFSVILAIVKNVVFISVYTLKVFVGSENYAMERNNWHLLKFWILSFFISFFIRIFFHSLNALLDHIHFGRHDCFNMSHNSNFYFLLFSPKLFNALIYKFCEFVLSFDISGTVFDHLPTCISDLFKNYFQMFWNHYDVCNYICLEPRKGRASYT